MKWLTVIVLVLLGIPLVSAISLEQSISDKDKETFNEILTPVMKIYNFLKYSASIIAALFLVFSAMNFMSSGDDQRKRENAKKSIGYVMIGLVIIWAVPYTIKFLVG